MGISDIFLAIVPKEMVQVISLCLSGHRHKTLNLKLKFIVDNVFLQ